MIDHQPWSPLEAGPVDVWFDVRRGLKLVAREGVSDDGVTLIERTRFGGDGLRYRRLDVGDHLNRLGPCVSLSLRSSDVVVGVYLLHPVELRIGSTSVNGIYRSTLCVAADHRGQGLGRLLVEHALAWLDQRAALSGRPVVSFGCIERNNTASMRLLSEAGSVDIGRLQTQMVYRQWPQRRLSVIRLEAASEAVVDARDHADIDCAVAYATPQQRDYYAVVEDSTIIAGAYANVCRLDFNRIGQPWDFLAKYLFAYVGPARRRFDPRNFTYLKLDGVVTAKGRGDVWKDFLSSLLAEHQTHMAMFALDPLADTTRRLEASGVFGRVAAATRQELVVLACHHGASRAWPRELEAAVSDAPLAVGPFAQ